MDWQIILPHGYLAAGLVAGTLAFHFVMYYLAHFVTSAWLSGAIQNGFSELPAEKLLSDATLQAAPWALRLQEQYEDARRHSIIQLKVYIDMQDGYYAATVTWTVLAAVATLLGVFLVKAGWSGADPYLINATLTVTVLLAFWQALPKMLSMSSNIAGAKKSYLACVQLGNELRSFAQQPHTAANDQTAAQFESDFINKADKRFSEIRNLNFDIDTTQAPDYRKAIQDQMKAQ